MGLLFNVFINLFNVKGDQTGLYVLYVLCHFPVWGYDVLVRAGSIVPVMIMNSVT